MTHQNRRYDIAFVDDEPLMGQYVRTVCRQRQREVDAFETAGALLSSPGLTQYRTICMDLTLTDMGARDLVSALGRVVPSVHLVIVSGHSRENLLLAKWHARINGILSCQLLGKPFGAQELLAVLGPAPP